MARAGLPRPTVPEELEAELAVASNVARSMGYALNLTGPDLDDLRGDVHLALMLLVHEWDPARAIPRPVFVGKYLKARTIDIYRARTHRRATTVHPISEIPIDDWQIYDRPVYDPEPIDVRWILRRARTDRERYVLERVMHGATLRDIGHELGVANSRVPQILDAIRRRCPPRQ